MLCLLLAGALAYPLNATCRPENRVYDCGSELLCLDGHCVECDMDAGDDANTSCASIGGNYFCRKSSKKADDGSTVHVCRYEPLVHKWGWRLIVCMIVMFFVGVLVSGVGIGGGALFVPAMQLVGGFPAEYAIASSNPVIFGGSLAVTIFNFRRKHPDYDRPLINYNVAAIIEPISWLGTIIGVFMNSASPEWLLYLAQVLLFTYTAYTTFKKGVAEYRKCKKAQDVSVETLTAGNSLGYNVHEAPGQYHELSSEPQQPKKAFSPMVVVVLGIMWAVFVVLPFIRGGNNSDSIVNIEFCSWLYWVVTFAPSKLFF